VIVKPVPASAGFHHMSDPMKSASGARSTALNKFGHAALR
jgi:hypothetical protein